jgi:choline dehydrogenase-like flavoprotein
VKTAGTAPANSLVDVIIVGSGAAGGMAAYSLTKAGLHCLLLEAGRDYDPLAEVNMLAPESDAPLRGAATPDKPFGYFDATVGGGWQVDGEPYTMHEGSDFRLYRPRMLGGRTNHWGRHVPRWGPYDFKPFSRDGLGVDWPIGYEDVAPYLRPRRADDRRQWRPDRAGKPPGFAAGLPDAAVPKPRVTEMLIKAACRERRHTRAPRPHRGADARQAGRGCPAHRLLQRLALQPWLHDRRDVPDDHFFPAHGQGHRPAYDRHRRHGFARDHGEREARFGRRICRSQDRRSPPGEGASRWCWPRAPARRRGCCSTLAAANIRAASPILPASWVKT